MEQAHHQMTLVRTYATGVDEWLCPECGRRFLMRYPPNYRRIVLEPGDECAAHSGGRGGLQMGGMHVAPAADRDTPISHAGRQDDEADADVPLDDEALRPWLKWLENPDLDEAV